MVQAATAGPILRPAPDKVLTVTASETGVAHGIAFWFDLHMDEKVDYHSKSPTRTNHWKQAMHFFPHPIPVRQGQVLQVVAGYDATRIYFNAV